VAFEANIRQCQIVVNSKQCSLLNNCDLIQVGDFSVSCIIAVEAHRFKTGMCSSIVDALNRSKSVSQEKPQFSTTVWLLI